MNSIKIMVVEDSPETRNTLKDIFEVSFSGSEVPCDVLISSSGEETFAKLESGVIPNLIILDIILFSYRGVYRKTSLKSILYV